MKLKARGNGDLCSHATERRWHNGHFGNMGHTRLGTLPATRSWNEVIGLISEGATAAKIAEATVNAWRLAFAKVQGDVGFREAIWLMTQLGVAGAHKNPLGYLSSIGLDIEKSESVVEVAMALTGALDQRIDGSGRRSDFGELAEKALISVVTENLQEKIGPRLLSSSQDVNSAVGKLGKVKEFAQLSRSFFQKLTNECLNYFLSKTLPAQVGETRRFATAGQLAQFEKALGTHCWEASEIVEKFSGEWLSKNRHEGGGTIARETAEKFGWFALRKMQLELEARARKDG